MVQRGQAAPLRVWDGYGGHRGDDLLFFIRLLRRVRVHAGDLPAGHAEWRFKEEKGTLMEICHQFCFANAFTRHNVSHTIFNG